MSTTTQPLDLLTLMDMAWKRKAADVHIAPGRPPALRIGNDMHLLSDLYPALSPDDTTGLLYSILRDDQRLALDRDWEIDLSYQLKLSDGDVRFRINMHRQNRGLAAVFRLIPKDILAPEKIGMEEAVLRLSELPRGLVLVTGPTGSGKSTTLASLLDQINRRERLHILTIEDPIEFIYEEAKCVVTQRELGSHTRSFAAALRSALREDPDVILVGEMRDFETIALALTASETGHLVFATLHTTDASQTVDRVVDVFPADQQEMVRTQLGGVLQGIVCQQLLPRADGHGRVAAREILLATPAVANHIRRKESHLLYSVMQGSRNMGMCPLELSLAEKVHAGVISLDTALTASSRPETVASYLSGMKGKPAAAAPTPPPPAPAAAAQPTASVWERRKTGA
ncbi:MAG: type IV pilus twitching motility protein PilT [Kiritimatiellae bacterium]|nr:type IV pilus twitching motility protein PilT [Kiritimatiellia bacterium]